MTSSSTTEREMTRKRYIESLETRTPEQIAEEEALYIEVRRLEQNERKFKRERENLLRSLAGMDSGLPDITEDDPIATGVITTGDVAFKVVKKKRGSLDESPATPSAVTVPALKRPNTTKNAVYGDTSSFLLTLNRSRSIVSPQTLNTASSERMCHLPLLQRKPHISPRTLGLGRFQHRKPP